MSHIIVWVCMSVCIVCMCVFVCVECSLAVTPTCVMDRGRERRAHVSPWQPTCSWPFIKPGGAEEREGLTVTDRALCGTRGGPCCLLTETAPPMRSFRTEPACRQRPRLRNKPNSIAFLFFFQYIFSCAFHTGPAGWLRRQVAMPTDDTQHPHRPTQRDMWHTPQTHGTCSSIRQTGPNAERLKPNLRVEQNTLGVWEWKRVNLLLDQHLEVTFIL